jgi:hypothetical protein
MGDRAPSTTRARAIVAVRHFLAIPDFTREELLARSTWPRA